MGALPLQHGFEMGRGGDEQDRIDDEMELEGVDADADGDDPRMSDIIFPEAFFNFDTADSQQWEFLTESAPFNQI